MHNQCSRTCFRRNLCASLRILFAPPGVQSWLRVCWGLLPSYFCQLGHSAQSFHNQNFQVYHQIVLGEINVKSFILVLYMHNNTKMYLRLNRNQN